MEIRNGSDEQIVRYLASHQDELTDEQQAIAFNPSTWKRYLPSEFGQAVLRLPDELGGVVTRDILKSLSDEALSRDGRRRLFATTMIWGLGRRNGRLLPKHRAAMMHTDFDSALRVTAKAIKNGLPGDAYRQWRRFDLPGLGEAFFTKWFYALGLAGVPEGALKPLVLDRNVWLSLRALGWSSERASGFKRRNTPAAGYCAYLSAAARWAAALSNESGNVTPEHVEHFLFNAKGNLTR